MRTADSLCVDVNLPKEVGDYLSWSPDGQTIALMLWSMPNKGEWERVFIVPARGGKLTELVTRESGDIYSLDWSPDGKWIAYGSEDAVKTRPEGVIWEVEIDSFLKKTAEKPATALSSTKD